MSLLTATKRKLLAAEDREDQLFKSLRRIKNNRKTNKAEMEKYKESINSLEFIISEMKSRHKSVAASPESAAMDYSFADDSQDEELGQALDMMHEKNSGVDGKGNEKETSV